MTVPSKPRGRKLGIVALICGVAGLAGVAGWFCLEPVLSGDAEKALGPILILGGHALGAVGVILGLVTLVIARRDVVKYLLAMGAIVAGGLPITPLVLSTIIHPPTRVRATLPLCVSNLRGIGQAMYLYAAVNSGRFPPDFETLIQMNLAAERQFLCPASDKKNLGDLHACYVYIAGQSTDSDPSNVLVYEKPQNHATGGVVLYLDGSVRFERPYSRVTELVAQTRQPLAEAHTTTQPDGGD